MTATWLSTRTGTESGTPMAETNMRAASPYTSDGRMSGDIRNAFRPSRPGNRLRTRGKAAATPSTTESAVAASATSRLRPADARTSSNPQSLTNQRKDSPCGGKAM